MFGAICSDESRAGVCGEVIEEQFINYYFEELFMVKECLFESVSDEFGIVVLDIPVAQEIEREKSENV